MKTLSILFARQPVLAGYGFVLLLGAAVTLGLQLWDTRTFDAVNVWVKPTKFFVSIGVFALTSAWFFGYVREDRRKSLNLQISLALILVCGTFELFWITWQAAQGTASHFNRDSLITNVMYGLMGLGALLLMVTLLQLTWEIARNPAQGLRPDYRFAAMAGLIVTVILGGGMGIYMGAQTGHAVGQVAGHFPLFGWNRAGGDLRVAHFFGMHIVQGLPVVAAVAAPLPARWRWTVILAALIALIAVTIFVFVQALAGQPFLAG